MFNFKHRAQLSGNANAPLPDDNKVQKFFLLVLLAEIRPELRNAIMMLSMTFSQCFPTPTRTMETRAKSTLSCSFPFSRTLLSRVSKNKNYPTDYLPKRNSYRVNHRRIGRGDGGMLKGVLG